MHADLSTDYANLLERERNIGFKGTTITDLEKTVADIDTVKCSDDLDICEARVHIRVATRCAATNKPYCEDCWPDHIDGIASGSMVMLAPCVHCQERREREREAIKLVPVVNCPDPANPEGPAGTLA
jgi:hypothetical protein